MTEPLSGRCLCGKIAWQSAGPILWAGHCHCESCRRASSSPVTSFFGVPPGSVGWTEQPAVYASSPGVERGYCAGCGSQMFFCATRWRDEIHLYAASLDDPGQFQPQPHYHYAERVPWLTITDDLPKHAGSAED